MAERKPLFMDAEGFSSELDPTADSITLAGLTMAGDIGMGSNKVTGLADGTAASDAVNKSQLDSVAAGFQRKDSVRLATDAALPANTPAGSQVGKTLTADANGALTVDGVAVAVADRILVKDETAVHNGIYTVTQAGDGSNPFILTRATDADGNPAGEVKGGMAVFVLEGTENQFSGWTLTNIASGVTVDVDTDDQSFTKFQDLPSFVWGAGLDNTGQTVFVDLATNPGLEFDVGGDAGKLQAKPDTARGLDKDASGIFIDLNTNPGLQFTGGNLEAFPDTNRGLSKDASGLFIRLPAANPGLQFVSGELDAKLVAAGGLEAVAGGLQVKIDDTPDTLDVDASGLKVVGLPDLFKVNDVAVGATVTAANLDTLTDGSNADALHVHAGADNAERVQNDLNVNSAVVVGDVVYWSATADRVAPSDAATLSTSRPIGVATTAQPTIGLAATVISNGIAAGAIAGATPGDRYYLAAGGGLTATRPTGTGNRVIQMGYAKNATDLWVEIQDFGRAV